MLTRDQIYKKYRESNIFNTKPPSLATSLSPNIPVSHPTLARTKQYLFNVEKKTYTDRHKEKK